MTTSTGRLISLIGSSGVVGCLIGASFERYRGKGSVSAATANVPAVVPPGSGDVFDASTPMKSHRLSEIMKFGYPSLESLRTFDNYVLSYDRRHRTAHWVFEHLTPESLKAKNVTRSKSDFFEDNSIHPYFRASLDDYRGSGFDRGHLAPAGNHRISQTAMDQTFVLSNISPQVGQGFNRDAWNYLEQYVRYRASHAKNLWVVTGPLYLPRTESDGKNYVRYQVIGKNHVAVPTHFYKVFVVENEDSSLEMECYVMQNALIDSNIPLRAFQVPLDSIERSAGVLLFPNVNPRHLRKINGDNKFLEKYTKNLQERLKEEQKKLTDGGKRFKAEGRIQIS